MAKASPAREVYEVFLDAAELGVQHPVGTLYPARLARLWTAPPERLAGPQFCSREASLGLLGGSVPVMAHKREACAIRDSRME